MCVCVCVCVNDSYSLGLYEPVLKVCPSGDSSCSLSADLHLTISPFLFSLPLCLPISLHPDSLLAFAGRPDECIAERLYGDPESEMCACLTLDGPLEESLAGLTGGYSVVVS